MQDQRCQQTCCTAIPVVVGMNRGKLIMSDRRTDDAGSFITFRVHQPFCKLTHQHWDVIGFRREGGGSGTLAVANDVLTVAVRGWPNSLSTTCHYQSMQ